MDSQNPVPSAEPQSIQTGNMPHPPPSEQHVEHVSNHRPKWPLIVILLLLLLLIPLAGYFILNENSKNSAPSPTPTVAQDQTLNPSPTPSEPIITEDPATAEWKTYTSTENGYSIKYPSKDYVRLICPDEEFTLSVRESETKDEINMPTCARDGRYEIEIVTNPTYEEPKTNQYVDVKQEEITFAGLTARKYISTKKPGVEGPIPEYNEDIFVDHNENKYLIYLSSAISAEIKNKILSTFKFTN